MQASQMKPLMSLNTQKQAARITLGQAAILMKKGYRRLTECKSNTNRYSSSRLSQNKIQSLSWSSENMSPPSNKRDVLCPDRTKASLISSGQSTWSMTSWSENLTIITASQVNRQRSTMPQNLAPVCTRVAEVAEGRTWHTSVNNLWPSNLKSWWEHRGAGSKLERAIYTRTTWSQKSSWPSPLSILTPKSTSHLSVPAKILRAGSSNCKT